jgi:hypothetical protein
MNKRYTSFYNFHLRFQNVSVTDYQLSGAEPLLKRVLVDRLSVSMEAVNVVGVRRGSVIVSCAVGFLESERRKVIVMEEALMDPAGLFASAQEHPFFAAVSATTVVDSELQGEVINPSLTPSLRSIYVVIGVSAGLLFGAAIGLYRVKLAGEGWREKLSARSLWAQRRIILNIATAIFDFASDILFVASINGVPWFRAYYDAGVAILGLHAFVAVITVGGTMIYIRTHSVGDTRHDLIKWDEFQRSDNVWLNAIILISCISNLEMLVFVPWNDRGYTLKYDGFPTAWLLSITYLSALIEDIPQIVMQSAFVNFEGGSLITFISLGFSGVSVLIRFVYRFILMLNPTSSNRTQQKPATPNQMELERPGARSLQMRKNAWLE